GGAAAALRRMADRQGALDAAGLRLRLHAAGGRQPDPADRGGRPGAGRADAGRLPREGAGQRAGRAVSGATGAGRRPALRPRPRETGLLEREEVTLMPHAPPRIGVVGSANIDLTFRTPRLPRAGETLAGAGFHSGCGGKGANQAVMAARLGARVAMIGR